MQILHWKRLECLTYPCTCETRSLGCMAGEKLNNEQHRLGLLRALHRVSSSWKLSWGKWGLYINFNYIKARKTLQLMPLVRLVSSSIPFLTFQLCIATAAVSCCRHERISRRFKSHLDWSTHHHLTSPQAVVACLF